MRAVLQRVTSASVVINGGQKRSISGGLVVLLAVGKDDTDSDASWLADKIVSLRVFPNEQGKFGRSLVDIRGDLLVISQFTLYGDCAQGRRPDFTAAASPEPARELYERFLSHVRRSELHVENGEFAADMLVEILNNGPVTLIIDTERDRPCP